MKATLSALLAGALALTGCSQDLASRNPARPARVAAAQRPDYFQNRRTITGSNIPMLPGQLTYSEVYVTAPPQSVAREHPSLYPLEPVVGATANPEPGTAPSNVGAGPAGSSPLPGSN